MADAGRKLEAPDASELPADPSPDASQDVVPEAGTLCLVPSPAAGYVTVPCPADLQDGGMGYTRVTDAVSP